MADGLLNKASIILTPTGYKAGTLYNVAPVVEPYEDFDFARASVASRVNSSGLVEMVGRTLGSELVQNGDFSELGSELVTNGNYSDAGVGNAISQSNGALVNENNQLKITSAGGDFSSYARGVWATSGSAGDTFVVEADIISISGSVRFYDQSNNGTYADLVAGSTYKRYIVLGSGAKNLGFGGNNDVNFELVLDNVSVKQVDPNDYWTKGAGWSIADGVANNDGTINAIYQPKAIQSGKIYKCTIDITFHSAGVAYWRLGNTTNIGVMSTNQTSFTQYLVGSANGNYVGIFTNTSITIDNVSVKEIIDTNNIPRINYDSNGENGHILLEPTSENKVTYSEDFSEWTNTDITFGTDGVSPSGETNANLIQTGTAGSDQVSKAFALSATNTTTYSVFIKRVSGAEWIDFLIVKSGFSNSLKVWFNINNGTIGSNNATGTTTFDSASIEDYNNDWYRLIVTTTDSTNNTSFNIRVRTASADGSDTRVNNSSYYLWGMQLEALSHSTSYIPTYGSTVTRATETATGAGSATLINSTEGVLYAEIAALSDTDTTNPNRGLSISSGSTNNTIYIYYQSTLNTLACILISNGTTQFSHSTSLFDVDNYLKIGLKYKQNDFALWVNGVEVATDTIGSVPIGLNKLAFDNGAGVDKFYGKCKAVAVFNEALSDTELTQLTT